MINILHEGDYHCGNFLGLTPPKHMAEMAHILKPMWDFRERELKSIGPVDIHIVGGDLIDGPGRKDSIGLFTTDLDTQKEWAIECVDRVKAKHRYFNYGSAYHVVASGNAEGAVANAFASPIADYTLLRVKNKRFNFRHFVGRSDIEKGQPGQLAREITRALIQEVLDGFEAADIYGRDHVHYYTRADLGDRTAYSCPAWELNVENKGSVYPRGLRTQYYHVGYTLIQIDNAGEIYIRPRWMRLSSLYPKEYLCPLEPKPRSPSRK